MIIEYNELGIGGKRSVTFAAQTDEEDALMVALHHAYHHGEIKLQAKAPESPGMAWVHPAPTKKEISV